MIKMIIEEVKDLEDCMIDFRMSGLNPSKLISFKNKKNPIDYFTFERNCYIQVRKIPFHPILDKSLDIIIINNNKNKTDQKYF